MYIIPISDLYSGVIMLSFLGMGYVTLQYVVVRIPRVKNFILLSWVQHGKKTVKYVARAERLENDSSASNSPNHSSVCMHTKKQTYL